MEGNDLRLILALRFSLGFPSDTSTLNCFNDEWCIFFRNFLDILPFILCGPLQTRGVTSEVGSGPGFSAFSARYPGAGGDTGYTLCELTPHSDCLVASVLCVFL